MLRTPPPVYSRWWGLWRLQGSGEPKGHGFSCFLLTAWAPPHGYLLPSPLPPWLLTVGRSQRAGGQREEDEQQKTAQGSPGKSLTLEGRKQWASCLVHLHSQVLAKGSLQAYQTPPTSTGCPQRQVSQSPGLADNSQSAAAQNAVLVDSCPSAAPSSQLGLLEQA